MQKFRCILIWHFPGVLLVFTRPLTGKLNFCEYLISRFYPTREIRKNLMHAKNMCFTVLVVKAPTAAVVATVSGHGNVMVVEVVIAVAAMVCVNNKQHKHQESNLITEIAVTDNFKQSPAGRVFLWLRPHNHFI